MTFPSGLDRRGQRPHLAKAGTLLFNSIKVNADSMNRPAQLELVGRKIRQLRRQRKLTQVELAEKIGIHQSDLSRMEQGEYKVGLDTLLKILQCFDLSIGDFFDENNRADTVLDKYRSLSPIAQKEVESFIEFKRAQESGDTDGVEGGDADA
ncbi:MAG TPA: helix-turn-helix transcriptional regulator [Thermoanaerobaculia bacterium]|nr:helix-turn-helix transcriptional regulator [Thermoanaerobaculia bacterium]